MAQKWLCNGVAKDGQGHSNQFSPGSHEPQENYGDDCVMCGLTQEQVLGGASKPPVKLIAVPVAVGIAAAIGMGSWAVFERLKPNQSPQIEESNPSKAPTSSEFKVPEGKVESRCSTDKIVKKSGNLFGAIEVGSKGIKGKVIQELETLNEDGIKLVLFRKEKIEDRNTDPIKPESKSATVESVRDVFTEVQKRFNIPCEQIVIYGSSGLSSELDKVSPSHKIALAQEVQQATGRAMEFITPEAEANFGFDGVVPEWRRSEVISIDIGSGNTKGAFPISDNQHDTFSIPFGTVTFTKEVERVKGTSGFQAAAEGAKKELAQMINNEIQRKPGMQNSPRVYLAGGISWAMSTLTRPCAKEYAVIGAKVERFDSFVPIRSEDIATFYNNVTQAPKALFEPNLSECSDKRRAEVLKDIEKIKNDTFSIENLIAGAEILRAFDKELGFSGKQVFFARSAKDALPIGYLKKQLEMIGKGDGR
jgi:Ppx/GppA phosphatase family